MLLETDLVGWEANSDDWNTAYEGTSLRNVACSFVFPCVGSVAYITLRVEECIRSLLVFCVDTLFHDFLDVARMEIQI